MAIVSGGPVAGLSVPDSQASIWVASRVNTYLSSGGHYTFTPPNLISWQAGTTGAGGSIAGATHQLDHAWRKLMQAYGITMPRALARSAQGRQRMKRVVR